MTFFRGRESAPASRRSDVHALRILPTNARYKVVGTADPVGNVATITLDLAAGGRRERGILTLANPITDLAGNSLKILGLQP